MTDYIIARILEIINGVGDMGTGIIIQTPQAFNDTLYNCAKTLQEDAAKPLGCIILGLVFMWELYNITIRNEGMNNMGWMIPFKAMFKIVVCKTVLDNIGLILGAMYDISNQLTKNIGAVYGSGAGLAISPEIETMRKAIDALDFSTKLMLSTQIFMIWVIFKFSSLLVNVILYGRMIEIYIFIAIAPLPLATFPHPEMSSIAKNFLKNFAAVCLQGSLIYLVVAMYGVLVKSVAINIDYNNITSTLLQATMYSLILVISIFTTGKWAKSICNAF